MIESGINVLLGSGCHHLDILSYQFYQMIKRAIQIRPSDVR